MTEEGDFRFPNPKPYYWNGLVWITNAQRLLRDPLMLEYRDGVRVGPPRPTMTFDLQQLMKQDIVGWYVTPIVQDASAPTSPPTNKPAVSADQFDLF